MTLAKGMETAKLDIYDDSKVEDVVATTRYSRDYHRGGVGSTYSLKEKIR